MQETNKTQKRPLQEGDGTVHKRQKTNDANWFGASHEPQEEFAEEDNQSPLTREQREEQDRSRESEGKPSI